MAEKTQKPVEPMKPEDAKELRADRDDALGYTREQVDIESNKKKAKKTKPKKK